MKTHKTSKAELLFVELPEGAKLNWIGEMLGTPVLQYKVYRGDTLSLGGFEIPKGDWQILGKLSEISEEQWQEIDLTAEKASELGVGENTVILLKNL